MNRSSKDIATTEAELRDHRRVDPMVVASLYAVASAILYTLTNIFLRRVAESCDPAWVSAIKAVPIALGSLVFVALRARRGQPLGLRRSSFVKLLIISVFVQFGGNLPFQWALGQLGLAIVVPITTAVIVSSGALFGLWWLGERVTLRGVVSMVLLVVAVTVLSTTAPQANAVVRGGAVGEPSAWVLAARAVVASCVAGLAYSATTATLRRALVRGVALPVGLAVISTTGVVGLSIYALASEGWGLVIDTTPAEWRDMAAAGVLNALAFATLGTSLHRITVTRSNILGASQTAMAAMAGVMFFKEPVSTALVAGVALTAASMVIIERRGAAPEAASTTAASTVEPTEVK
jgi:drug/metabolite transporter (DMT)-like permease